MFTQFLLPESLAQDWNEPVRTSQRLRGKIQIVVLSWLGEEQMKEAFVEDPHAEIATGEGLRCEKHRSFDVCSQG